MQTHGIDSEVYDRRWVILGVLCLSLVLVVAAVSSINIAIPSIRTQLKPTDAQLLWIVDIYAVVFAGLLLPAGALGDKFGRKGALQIGLIVFGLGSVLQPGPQPERAARVPVPHGSRRGADHALDPVVGDERLASGRAPEGDRGVVGFRGAGGVIGTLLGGFVLAHFWFGSVFFVSVPIALTALVLVTTMCPSSKGAHDVPLDPIGALLSVIGSIVRSTRCSTFVISRFRVSAPDLSASPSRSSRCSRCSS